MAALTRLFHEALVFATERHQGQVRKGTQVPYVSHLLGTCALTLESGGDEDQAIAALLHDTIEDGKATFEELASRFGPRVADIVLACSDSEGNPKPPWRQRKERYLDDLADHGDDALLVSASDKLHNLRAIVSDYRLHGEELWSRFNPDADQLWYYAGLVDVFRRRQTPLAAELEATLGELQRLRAKRDTGDPPR